MSSFESQTRQECLNKRITTKYYDMMSSRSSSSSCNDPPAVTVVVEGRSICQMISLHKLGSYQSLAKTLNQMFVDSGDIIECSSQNNNNNNVDLSNALPGHLIAYEDIENDLLLVGDLSWKDFVKVAKRIRILPAKPNSRTGRVENNI
ncbi:auxin-responsive protein IAA33 [Solanum pennellii]|uniref:Auxin-responsive protein n=1 Tax=Solanum pennellii TaxID=28526 RepID=A0ABM1H8C6_SOLPN|nr:auxin-responsive protein IAA33 [Solanum pennellii]